MRQTRSPRPALSAGHFPVDTESNVPIALAGRSKREEPRLRYTGKAVSCLSTSIERLEVTLYKSILATSCL
ncbi:MAG: hypothetical protein ACI8PT_004265 [Gammaproteobacteria bacterium]|jgi:hypothetical protein